MKRAAAGLLLAVACSSPPIEKVRPKKTLPDAGLTLERQPVPPLPHDPPPPPPDMPVPSPATEIASFILAHGFAPDPWKITVYALVRDGSGEHFLMEWGVRQQRAVSASDAQDLLAHLLQPRFYFRCCEITGAGVQSWAFGIRLERGGQHLDFVDDQRRLSIAQPGAEHAELSYDGDHYMQMLFKKLL
jgi:hypothetical protein